ncbi:glycosyltransferase [Acetobacter senegalensis]|uniref:glycosyltransferase n=1 Tax=Acetobacter senegalensis TaxID=446692 RepID=UPI00128D93EF|nr:glycosyltransferase [Acetobacter senegalensis]MCG4258118.1 glycosyltransferase [Acetobacter senegalensis]MCG4268045.1 glycosyltransferase [Acetobacter senegalensis]MPQ75183.1 glycosyltransferase [Acetobacter senegalensis]
MPQRPSASVSATHLSEHKASPFPARAEHGSLHPRPPAPDNTLQTETPADNRALRIALADALTELSLARSALADQTRRIQLLEQAEAERERAFQVITTQLADHQRALAETARTLTPHPSRLRRLWRTLRYPPVTPALPDAPVLEALPSIPPSLPQRPAHRPLPPPHSGPRKILFVAGELDTTGRIYRCERMATAFAAAGVEVRVLDCPVVGPDDVNWADALVIWRTCMSEHVSIMLRLFQEQGKPTIFDIDDLVFRPDLAKIEIIDGIRHGGTVTEETTCQIFTGFKQTVEKCDMAFTTTLELADELFMTGVRPVVVLPNTFDHETQRRGRLAARRKQLIGPDGLIRIGYAAGSRTHQRDFKLVSQVLADLLRADNRLRLVLFTVNDTLPLLLMEEFPELSGLEEQIEWRTFVPLVDLPAEMARFDISIIPLETDNVFCEAKSEIKFFEAALGNVCSIASPTAPFRRIIQHGQNGLLASTADEWREGLLTLIRDPALRQKLACNAFNCALWFFGPERLSFLARDAVLSMGGGLECAQASARLITGSRDTTPLIPVVPDSETLFLHDQLDQAEVSVVVTSYNYEHFILEGLESVVAQTLDMLDLIIVDDGSTDGSVPLILAWAAKHASRFNRLLVLRSISNAGLGGARNIGMAATETPYVMQLDADNRLAPTACERLIEALKTEGAAFAYPIIEQFGARIHNGVLGNRPFQPLAFMPSNYIDAMAMVAKWAWAAVGGYYVQRDAMGWEDFDLWCNFAERGFVGVHVPEILAQYRRHTSSMTNAVTETPDHKPQIVSLLEARHPWLRLTHPHAAPRDDTPTETAV